MHIQMHRRHSQDSFELRDYATERKVMEEKKYETDCKSEKKNCISGVMCEVKNCVYHDEKNACYAGRISVGPREADCSAGTACATFKPKQY